MFCEKIIVLNQRNIVIGSFKLLLNNPFLKGFKVMVGGVYSFKIHGMEFREITRFCN